MRSHVAVLGAVLSASGAFGQTVLYVDDDAGAGGDGSSWATGFRYLQDAVDAANAGAATEIRIAQGTYYPDRDESGSRTLGDEMLVFSLKPDLDLIGGYRGLVGGGDPDERDPSVFVTTLSGDIGTLGDDSDNSDGLIAIADYSGTPSGASHIAGLVLERVRRSVATAGALDAFAVEVLIEDCVFQDIEIAGAIACRGAFNQSSPPLSAVVQRCTVRRISAGARTPVELISFRGRVAVVDCLFESNSTQSGRASALNVNFVPVPGGPGLEGPYDVTGCELRSNDGESALVIDDPRLITVREPPYFRVSGCLFSGNTTPGDDAALYGSSYAGILEDTVFESNHAQVRTGAAGVGGIWWVRRCVFRDNRSSVDPRFANWGAGALRISGGSRIRDCEFSGNTSTSHGGALFVRSGYPAAPLSIDACSFVDNDAGVSDPTSMARGGAIGGRDAIVHIANSLFCGNRSVVGGAVNMLDSGPLVCSASVFAHNTSDSGPGGLAFEGLPSIQARVDNVIFWGNTSDDPGGASEQVQIDGTQITYSGCLIQDWPGDPSGVEILTDDPLFVD